MMNKARLLEIKQKTVWGKSQQTRLLFSRLHIGAIGVQCRIAHRCTLVHNASSLDHALVSPGMIHIGSCVYGRPVRPETK